MPNNEMEALNNTLKQLREAQQVSKQATQEAAQVSKALSNLAELRKAYLLQLEALIQATAEGAGRWEPAPALDLLASRRQAEAKAEII